MDLVLNNLQRLICHKTQTTNQNKIVQKQLKYESCYLPMSYRLIVGQTVLFIIGIATNLNGKLNSNQLYSA